jgi:hypothetical protein
MQQWSPGINVPPIPGIVGECDRDIFFGDQAALEALTLKL